ncbi:MAG: nucleoside 2-deoxyribosyltransferase [Nitrosomonadales bacterium]|nr:nucleoside 2-deoxyribosyltransferase [Nitrosomonadales bacterium]
MSIYSVRPLVYLAAPLFSQSELAFNLDITALLEKHLDVYLPQRDGGKVVDLVARGVSICDTYASIFERDLEALKNCHVLLIILDGRAIDEGAAFELGVAFSTGKVCLGLQTDPRRLLPLGNNPMIECALETIFFETADLDEWAKKFATQASGKYSLALQGEISHPFD